MTLFARDSDVGSCRARLTRLKTIVGIAAGNRR